ncbi:hypothetical protein Lal_00027937 [Lupinus albus]|nr:hypothetical protein Lal_00027937 [Lupinus albus]
MASSSKTKTPRTSGSKSKQGESSSKSNPLNLKRLLANDEQRKNISMDAKFSLQNTRTKFIPGLFVDIELQFMYAIKYKSRLIGLR